MTKRTLRLTIFLTTTPFVRVYQNGTLVQSIYNGSDDTAAEKVDETPYSVWSTGSIIPIELNPDVISNLNSLYW